VASNPAINFGQAVSKVAPGPRESSPCTFDL
jgi:hypothetical protein